ncbi:MAG: hypothetical protein IPK16_31550 [Anaerolineales bacterium]|nr:hypothetical protein [Anaerolineales bacterium]
MKAIDDAGGSSFAEYMTPLMTLALKQGFGRLIRRSSDRGVVAILDERLTSKGYGRQARRDLPPARFSREFRDVHRFYQDALETRAEFAVNVWAWQPEKGGAGMRWRWQLLRLQDGKADLQDGIAKELNDPIAAELHAAALGLQDLHDRIQRAGRKPEDFTVEVRCSPLAVALNQAAALPGQATWRSLRMVPIPR